MSNPAKVLAVDDNEEALFVLEGLLSQKGFSVVTASSGREALQKAEKEVPDIVLLDVTMPQMDGYEVTRRLKADALLRFVPVILLTALDNLEDITHGLDQGADDYITKPYESEELFARMQAAMRRQQLYRELDRISVANRELQERVGERFSFSNIIGRSSSMRDVFALMDKIKDSQVPVLITGDSGTGKELIASAIHYNSPRQNKPFVAQNCSAFNDSLLESELFGHVRGAFTGAIRDKAGLFETANGGTFFLDELGEMSPALQVKLLRVLQDGTFMSVGDTKPKKVDVRIIAATNRDLQQMVAAGTFREDLYYRLNVVNIKLPSLRERRNDIPLLVDFFLARHAEAQKSAPKRITVEALRLLVDYDWPGNIRQLENEMERMILMSGKEAELTADLVSPAISQPRTKGGSGDAAPQGKLKDALENLEKNMIVAALDRLGWNKSEAARELGISRSNLIAKVREYGLEEKGGK